MSAELVVRDRVPAPPVAREIALACQQAECLRKGIGRPQPHLGVDRAVALAGAGADVEIRLEADGAAVAAPGISLEHRTLRQSSVFRHCTMTGTVTAQSGYGPLP